MRQHMNNEDQMNRSEYKKTLNWNQRQSLDTQLNKDSKHLGQPKIAEQFAITKIFALINIASKYCIN